MVRCKFLYDNLWKRTDAEMIVSSEEMKFPATNTQRRSPGKRWITTNCVDDQYIVRNFYEEVAAEAFAIRGNNFSADAVVKIQGNVEDAWDTPAFEATLIPIDERIMAAHFGPDPVIYQYWRLVVSDPTNPDGHIEVGPLFLGPGFTPERNYRNGGTFEPEDLSVITKSAGGQRSVVIQDQPGLWQYSFRTKEKAAFEAIRALVGQSLPFWFCEDPDADNPNEVTLYVIALSWKWQHVHLDVWDLTLTLAEEM